MSPRSRAMLCGAVLAGALGLAWMNVIAPKRQEAAALAQQVVQAEQRRDAAMAQAAIAEAARGSYEANRATYVRLSTAVPETANVASLVLQLEAAAASAHVDFRSIRVDNVQPAAPAPAPASPDAADKAGSAAPAPAPASPGAADKAGSAAAPASAPSQDVTPVPFSFTFTGDYFALRRLLAAIHGFARVRGSEVSTGGRLLTVDAVSLNAGDKGLPNVKAEMTARAYVAPIAEPLATSGGAP